MFLRQERSVRGEGATEFSWRSSAPSVGPAGIAEEDGRSGTEDVGGAALFILPGSPWGGPAHSKGQARGAEKKERSPGCWSMLSAGEVWRI